MQRIGWDESHKFLQERRWGFVSPFSPINNGVPHNNRQISSYHKLPQQLLKLSVLKLDGSSFDVQVARTASVMELKQAVEEVFSQSPKEGEGKISWSHVWGHFCLCYEGNKLVNDKASLRTFGIKDGDQLKFIRHLSINRYPMRQHHTSNSAAYEQHRMSLTGSDFHEENGKDSEDDDEDDNDQEDGYFYDANDEEKDSLGQSEFRLAHYLRGWLSYSRLWCARGRMQVEDRARPSRFGGNCRRVGSKLIQD
ncbi:uncharacterized protein LOC143878276 [Tasmannia lanceolata]|uniref:uncharacterized protein LOC143878276 n=1 Tax=Tasmannia lanceolata TaxID=3420 RepID=UPI00406311BB